ncbi:MAG: DnaD domain protein [Erysipelotrichaceae bacterium]|nr:DnaD domain protein [Erysipelotrichaceae bacterium]
MENKVLIQLTDSLQMNYNQSLTFLYYPLIGKDSYILYQFLLNLNEQYWDKNQILECCCFHENQFERARENLEEFGLLKTYLNANKNSWIFCLCPPLSVNEFFCHESYARIFINECGSKRYDALKSYFHIDPVNRNGYIEVTKPFDTQRLVLWNDQKEEVFQRNKKDEKRVYSFNFDEFFQGMDRIFPLRLRNEENLSFIAQLASIYGIDEKEMKRMVQRSVHPSTKEFDKETLKKLVFSSSKIQMPPSDSYKMAPVQFLKYKQNGTPISSSDKKLVESLCLDYSFPNEVVNVLIEYCLEKTNQSLTRNYVEKVASSWSRLHIDTKEKALSQIQKKPVNKKVPEWYENTTQTKASEKSLQKALSLQKKLKGDKS